MIPAGSTGPVALSVSASTCGGQIDIKAVFTANGDTPVVFGTVGVDPQLHDRFDDDDAPRN